MSGHLNSGPRRLIDDWGLWNAEGDFVHDPEATRHEALPTASGTITRLAYAHAKEAGVELEPVLKKAHLTLHEIENPDARLRVRDQIRFLNLVAVAVQDDFLGFHLAQPPDLREMGWLYYVAASSEIMSDALKRGARYSSTVNEGISLKYIEKGDVAIRIDYVGVSRHLDRHQMEFLMTTLVRLCRQLTGLRLVPSRVRFTHHRENTTMKFFVEFFGSDVEFGATADEIVFATAIKTMPVVSADPYLSKLLISYFDEALSRRPASPNSFRSSVENTIVPLLPHGKGRAGEIAPRLGLSQRTFARRLSLEGHTFSEVLEKLRSDLAERYLTDESLSISKIAWLLGYQEVSAFTHAFKRWSGKTPREARARISPERLPAQRSNGP
jgi:AraC-like DNA-binding protein